MGKKMQGVSMAMDNKPISTMSLEGKNAMSTKGHKVGAKAKFMVHATKKSHYMNSDGTHSAGFNIDKVEMTQDPDDFSGPNDKAANNQKNGGKIA